MILCRLHSLICRCFDSLPPATVLIVRVVSGNCFSTCWVHVVSLQDVLTAQLGSCCRSVARTSSLHNIPWYLAVFSFQFLWSSNLSSLWHQSVNCDVNVIHVVRDNDSPCQYFREGSYRGIVIVPLLSPISQY